MELTRAFKTMKGSHYHTKSVPMRTNQGLVEVSAMQTSFMFIFLLGASHLGEGVLQKVHNPYIISIFSTILLIQKSSKSSKKDYVHSLGDISPFLSYFTFP